MIRALYTTQHGLSAALYTPRTAWKCVSYGSTAVGNRSKILQSAEVLVCLPASWLAKVYRQVGERSVEEVGKQVSEEYVVQDVICSLGRTL